MTRTGALVVFALLLASFDVAAQEQPRKQIISTPGGPIVAAPFSPAVRSGRFVFFAGAIGRNPTTREMAPGGISAEVRQTLENLRETARLAGLDLNDMIKCTVFLTDIGDFDAMNKVYSEFFPTDPPARSTVGVASLVLGAKVEIECIGAAR
jgi:2-iminobutanoate/2-iminopropanoate deaminase